MYVGIVVTGSNISTESSAIENVLVGSAGG